MMAVSTTAIALVTVATTPRGHDAVEFAGGQFSGATFHIRFGHDGLPRFDLLGSRDMPKSWL
jgi:hypothetical protein